MKSILRRANELGEVATPVARDVCAFTPDDDVSSQTFANDALRDLRDGEITGTAIVEVHRG